MHEDTGLITGYAHLQSFLTKFPDMWILLAKNLVIKELK